MESDYVVLIFCVLCGIFLTIFSVQVEIERGNIGGIIVLDFLG